MRRRLIVAVALGLTLVGVGEARSVATTAGALEPTTLVSVSSAITAFAQDGDRIAWSSFASECEEPVVHVFSLSTRARTALPSKPGPKTCDIGDLYPAPTLALAGERALWPVYNQSNTETDGYFLTAAVHDRVERRACGFGVLGGTEESYTPTLATAGDGQTLVFTMTGNPGETGHVCSGLWRVDPHGRASWILAKAPTLLAVSGARIALAQTTNGGGCVCNSGPTWSPDGTRIAFTSGRSGRSEIYLVNADGTGEHRVAQGDSPEWSPDGREIVFGRQGGEHEAPQVAVVSADGSGERVVGMGSAPRWSPNGERIAFSRETSEETDLVVVAANGSNETVVRNAFYDWAWSPDSGRIAFTGTDGIHVIGVDGTGERLVARGAERAAWSPDGAKLAFVGNFPHSDITGRYDVEVVNADGSGRHAIARSSWTAATWSPDGAKVLFEHDGTLEVVAADGTGVMQLTHPNKGLSDIAESWSPDGRMLDFERGRYNHDDQFLRARLWLMNSDGSGLHPLTGGATDETDPAWSPEGGRIAFTRGELYVVRADGQAETRITRTQPTEARSSAELRSVPTGRLVATAAAAGRVLAVALSHSTAALLVEGFFGRRIELFDAKSTVSSGTFSVSASTAPELSASGADVVFRVRNTIYLLDGQRQTMRILATAASSPIGLSIEGRRVAWAENVRGHGRIRGVVVPSR